MELCLARIRFSRIEFLCCYRNEITTPAFVFGVFCLLLFLYFFVVLMQKQNNDVRLFRKRGVSDFIRVEKDHPRCLKVQSNIPIENETKLQAWIQFTRASYDSLLHRSMIDMTERQRSTAKERWPSCETCHRKLPLLYTLYHHCSWDPIAQYFNRKMAEAFTEFRSSFFAEQTPTSINFCFVFWTQKSDLRINLYTA